MDYRRRMQQQNIADLRIEIFRRLGYDCAVFLCATAVFPQRQGSTFRSDNRSTALQNVQACDTTSAEQELQQPAPKIL